MNRFKCPACGGEQYTACDTAKDCIYCGNEVLEKAEMLNSIIEWDEEGYPTEESLEKLEKQFQESINKNDFQTAYNLFYKALKENISPNCCGKISVEVRGEIIDVWEYHTLGWSGNESIISILQNTLLWNYLLERYDAGGHYYFKPWGEVKKILESEGES